MRLPVKLRIGLSIILGVLIVVFALSFFSPFVPLSSVTVNGSARIPVKKIMDYASGKLFLGMFPTTNAVFDDAGDALGPLLETFTVKKRFFYSATIEIKEKSETYTIGMNAGKVAVDIEGNLVETVMPGPDAPTLFEVGVKTPNGFETLEPALYQRELSTLTSLFLKNRDLALSPKKIYHNSDKKIIASSGKLVVKNTKDFLEDQEIPEMVTLSQNDCISGLVAETNQGTLIVFGNSENLDVKFGALMHLLSSLLGEKKPLPAVIKLDVPYQVTTVPWRMN